MICFLGNVSAQDNIQGLIDILNTSDNAQSRMDAANTLAEMGEDAKPAVTALAKALSDEDNYVRNFAANALAEIGPGAIKALPQLMKAMEDMDKSVSMAAQMAIGAIGPAAKEAIPMLIIFLKHWDSSVAESPAAYALIRIGEPAIPAIAKLMQENDKDLILKGLYCIEEMKSTSRASLNTLRTGLNSFDPEISEKSAITLRNLGKVSVPIFISELSNKDSFVRKQSAWALGRLGDKGGKKALPKLRQVSKRDRSSAVKAAANWAIEKITGKKVK